MKYTCRKNISVEVEHTQNMIEVIRIYEIYMGSPYPMDVPDIKVIAYSDIKIGHVMA